MIRIDIDSRKLIINFNLILELTKKIKFHMKMYSQFICKFEQIWLYWFSFEIYEESIDLYKSESSSFVRGSTRSWLERKATREDRVSPSLFGRILRKSRPAKRSTTSL